MDDTHVIYLYIFAALAIVVGITALAMFMHYQDIRRQVKVKVALEKAREAIELNELLKELHESDRRLIDLLKSQDH